MIRLLSLALLLGLAAPALAADGEWGSLKGRIVWGEKEPPAKELLKVDKDQAHCLSKGPLEKEEYVVNPKNGGVRWVVVWIARDKGTGKAETSWAPLPIHPLLQEPKEKEVVMDQPCCRFEPHVLAMRQGQVLVIKNSAPIDHNANVQGGALGPNKNPLMKPGTTEKFEDIKARPTPILITCSIHGWMKNYIRVFDHPYFAVTDADGNFEIKNIPAGNHRLVIWHDSGWVVGEKEPDKHGVALTIKPGETKTADYKLKKSSE